MRPCLAFAGLLANQVAAICILLCSGRAGQGHTTCWGTLVEYQSPGGCYYYWTLFRIAAIQVAFNAKSGVWPDWDGTVNLKGILGAVQRPASMQAAAMRKEGAWVLGRAVASTSSTAS